MTIAVSSRLIPSFLQLFAKPCGDIRRLPKGLGSQFAKLDGGAWFYVKGKSSASFWPYRDGDEASDQWKKEGRESEYTVRAWHLSACPHVPTSPPTSRSDPCLCLCLCAQDFFHRACEELDASAAETYQWRDFVFRGTMEVCLPARLRPLT